MRLSRYIHVTSNDSQVYVTGFLRRCVVRMETSDWKNIVNGVSSGIHDVLVEDKNLQQELIHAKILVDDDFDELEYVVKRSISSRVISNTFGLVIVPSMSCNMSCHYCFENKTDKRKLSAENIRLLINFAEEKLSNPTYENLHVRWFGGEPLNDPELVLEITERLGNMCFKRGCKFSGDIVTNGYNLNADLAKRLSAAGLDSLQITFEGEKRQHDKIRKVGKIGSYQRLIENIVKSSKYLDVRIRIHVAPYNLDGIPRMLRDFQQHGIQKTAKYIYFAPLFNYKQDQKNVAFQTQPKLFLSSKDFAKKSVALSRLARDLGFTLADPLDTHYSVCTALREYTAVVNPDGSLVKCYMDAGDREEIFGSLSSGVTQSQNISKWRNSLFTDDEECKNCKFSPVCLGGCAKEVMNGAEKSAICTPLKYNIDDIIPIHYS